MNDADRRYLDSVSEKLGERITDEFEAAHAAMDRKERELDEHGYGGDPQKPPARVVGLDSFVRPPREDYVRVTSEHDGWTCEPAVEYRDGDSFSGLAAALKQLMEGVTWTSDAIARARVIAKLIEIRWPDRAYFVEVWQDGQEGFAQVFQPFGVPRNR
jgi:hypothetical protein